MGGFLEEKDILNALESNGIEADIDMLKFKEIVNSKKKMNDNDKIQFYFYSGYAFKYFIENKEPQMINKTLSFVKKTPIFQPFLKLAILISNRDGKKVNIVNNYLTKVMGIKEDYINSILVKS